MARKQLNKNVVVGFTLTVFATIIFLSWVMVRQLARRDPKHFVTLAERYEQSEEWRQAALFYGKAWERSEDPVYLVSFGQMMLNEGEVKTAAEAWQRALIRQPDLVAAHVRFTELLLEYAAIDSSAANWRQVQEEAIKFLEVDDAKKGPAEQALAHRACGLAMLNLLGTGENTEAQAMTHMQEAIKLAPKDADNSLDLAAHFVRVGRVPEADAVFARLLAEFEPDGAQASKIRLALARHLSSSAKRDFVEADKAFRESIAAAANDAKALREAKLGYATFLSQEWARAARDASTRSDAGPIFERTESLLKECIAADVENFDSYVQLAVLYTAAARHAEVVDVCEQRLSREFSRKGLESIRRRLGYFNLLLHASEACAAQALAAGTSNDKASEESWFQKAEQYVERAKGEFQAHPRVLAQSGRLKVARGQDRAALNDLRAADEAYRGIGAVDWQNKILLAKLHLRLSEPGAAQAVLDEVYDKARTVRASDPGFWLLYGQVLFMNNQWDRALAMSERVLQMEAENREARQLKAWIYEKKGMLADAGDLDVQVTGSGVVRALLKYRELENRGSTEEGLRVLTAALEQDPADVRLVTTAATALSEAQRKDEAAAIVSRALAAKPDDVVLRKLAVYTRADLSSEQRDDALRELIEDEPDGYQRALEMAGFHMRRTEKDKALESISQAERHLEARDTPMAKAVTSSQHRALLTQKLRLAVQVKNEAAAAAAREMAAQQNVDGAGGKSILGLYHLFRDEMEPAIRALREAVEVQPTDSESLTYLGHCFLNTGRREDAKACFERAVRINPEEPMAHRGLAAIAQAQGDKEAYEAALIVCQRLTPNDPWVRAETLARKEQAEPAAAIAKREAMLVESPDDAENLGRLIALSETLNDRDRADRYVVRLLELRPNDESAVVSSAKYFRRTQRPERALEVLTRYANSRTSAEDQAYAQILIAAHYLSQNDTAAAETTLLAAADKAQTLPVLQSLAEFYIRTADRPDKALPWLDQSIKLAKESKSPQLPQILATSVACLLHRRLNDTATARKQVDELRQLYPEDLRGLYWDSEVYARTGEVEKAVATLSDYLKKRPNDSYVLFQRARWYLSLGRTGAALADLEQIKRTDPLAQDLEPRILLAQLHSRAGRPEVALRELEALVQDAPLSARAGEELVRAYLSANRMADAERVVTAQINRAPDSPEPRWLFLRGDIALALGNIDRALTDYRQGAEISGFSAEHLGQALDMFVKAGRFAEGAEFYRKAVETTTPTIALQSKNALLTARSGRLPEAVNLFRAVMNQAAKESLIAVRIVLEDLQRAFAPDQVLAVFESTPCDPRLERANQRLLVRIDRLAGRMGEAAARLERAVASAESDTERAGLLYETGELKQVAGKAAEARAAYEESLQYDNRNWVALNNLAYLLAEKLHEYSLALPYARQAVALNDTPDTLDTLGWVYVGLGNYPAAIAELSRAVRLDPSQALLLYHLGEAYRLNGQFLEAGDVLQRGLEAARAEKDPSLIESLTASLEKNSRRETDR